MKKFITVILFVLACALANTHNIYAQYYSYSKTLEKNAQKGDVKAQLAIADAYYYGRGIKKNVSLAVEWYKVAAGNGSKEANEFMARYYLQKGDVASAYCYDQGLDLHEYLDDSKSGLVATKMAVSSPFEEDEQRSTKIENSSTVLLQKVEAPCQDPKKDVTTVVEIKSVKQGPQVSDVDSNIPLSQVKREETFAVIIANEDYRYEVPVEYAKNDGEAFRKYCGRAMGIPDDNIHYVANATVNDIYMELAWLENVAKAYDGDASAIIYYAGHGVPDEKTGTSYLLPVDGKGSMLRTAVSLSEFFDDISKMRFKNSVLFIDACFSGSKRGEGMLASARGVAIKAKPAGPKGNMIVFSAAQGDETAYPYADKRHGLFTYFLLEKLQQSHGECTLGELEEYIVKNVSRRSIVKNGKSQTPSVNAASSMTDSWRGMKL